MSGNHWRSSSVGLVADALDILHHREADGVGIDAAEARIVEARLEDDAGVGMQEFQQRPVAHQALLMQTVHDVVVGVSGAPLVHQLGLLLRIEVLGDPADDAQDLALPLVQTRRLLFQEVEDVFLGQRQQRLAVFDRRDGFLDARLGRNRPPEVVIHLAVIFLPLILAALLFPEVERLLARIAVDTVAHQGMGGVERALDRLMAVALLAFEDEGLGEFQIVQDALGIGPLAEQIVVLEEVVVAEGGVRDHQRLHRHGILFHDVADAGAGVDHDFIGQTRAGPCGTGSHPARNACRTTSAYTSAACRWTSRRPASARP